MTSIPDARAALRALRRIPGLQKAVACEQLARTARPKLWAARDIVVEHRPGHHPVLLLVEGALQNYRVSAAGEVGLETHHGAGFVGALECVFEPSACHRFVARTPGQGFVFPAAAFHTAWRNCAALAPYVLAGAARQYFELCRRVEGAALWSMAERIAAVNESLGAPPPSKSELARILGVNRRSVARAS